MEGFTPYLSTIGGLLIGLAALALLYLEGRIAGASGIIAGVLRPQRGETRWRAVFISGLLAGALLIAWLHPEAMRIEIAASDPAVILAGLLVGFGTRIGNGCTSGHGVCGVGRLAPRSIVASSVFVSVALFTVYLVRHHFGGL
jgi:uncharacterized membrane protein YedE/YeeE